MLDVTALTRDAKRVHESLKETNDGKLIAVKSVRIHIPSRYVDKGIAVIGATITIPGVYGIIAEDRFYGFSSALSYLSITPDSVRVIDVGEEKFHEFSFDAGSVICPSVNLLRDDIFVYGIWEEVVSMGKHPWYMNVIDQAKLLSTSILHGNVRLVADNATMELITAYLNRCNDDMYRQFRHDAKSYEDLLDQSKSIILALNDIAYVAPNTLAKITGAYLDQGITSALVDKSDSVDQAERIYRMNVK